MPLQGDSSRGAQTVRTSFFIPRVRVVEPAAPEDPRIRLKAVLRMDEIPSPGCTAPRRGEDGRGKLMLAVATTRG